MKKTIITSALLLTSVAAAYCAEPLIGTAMADGRHSISVGEAVAGRTGNIGDLHITAGRVQGILELTESSVPGIEIGREVKVSIYPNPTSQLLNVERNSAEEAVITLTSTAGAMMLQQTSSDSSCILDLQNLPCGIYILSITSENHLLYTSKVIKR